LKSRPALTASTITLSLVLVAAATSSSGAPWSPRWLSSAPPEIAGRVLVKFRAGASGAQIAQAHSRLGAAIRYRSRLTGWEAVTLPEGTDLLAALRKYLLDPSVESAEYALPRRITKVPNDLRLDQWGLHNKGQTIDGSPGTAGADIHAAQAWDLTVGSLGVVVAVLDTGVDLTRSDLSSRLTSGFDFVNNDTLPADDEGHGTAVSSVLGAVGNNGIRMTGVDWKVTLMPVKVCDSNGTCDEANILQGIDFAVTNGAKVINMSLSCDENFSGSIPNCPGLSSGTCFTQAEFDAIAAAGAAGVTVVEAAGNCGGNNDDSTSAYPCAHDLPNNICAGATNKNDGASFFSNFGPQSVDVGAPGEEILAFERTPPGGFALVDGTSFSSPMTAGVAALLLSRGPFAPAAVRSRIVAGGDDVNGLDAEFEGGRLDAFNAVKDVFLPGLPYAADLPGMVNLIADVNGDGRADLIRGGGGGFSVSLASPTKMKFRLALQWTSTLPAAVNLTGDVDGDGRVDLILGDAATGFQVLRSAGTTFHPVETWSAVGAGLLNAAGDFNGDHLADVLIDTGTFDVMLSTGSTASGFAAPTTWSNDTAGSFIAAADVDGDGKDDLVNWTPNGNGAHVDVGISTGLSFAASTLFLDAEPLDPNGVLVPRGAGDFDGDGKTDLLATDTGTGCLMVLRSTGTAFEKARAWACPQGPLVAILPGPTDRSRDARADVVVNVGGTSWELLRSVK